MCGLSVAIAACGGGTGSGDDTGTIKIGSLHPLTGSTAIEGQVMDAAVKMAIEDINAGGGIECLGGRQLEVVAADTTGDPDVGQTAMQRMLDEGVVAVIGAFNSAVTTNIVSVAERAQVPLVIDVSAAKSAVPEGSQFAFRLQPTGVDMGVDGARYLREVAEQNAATVTKIATMHEKSNFGSDVAAAFKEEAESLGMEVGLEIAYDAAQVTDLTTELARVKAYDPDVLMVSGYYNDGLLLARNAVAVQPDIQAVWGIAQAAYDQPQFPADAPDASNGFFDVNYHYDATSAEAMELRERFQEKTGSDMRTTAVYSYQAALVLQDALSRACSTEPADIRQALSETNLEQNLLAFEGPIAFDENGENKNAEATVMQVQGQEVPQVYPKGVAEAELIWPAVPWQLP